MLSDMPEVGSPPALLGEEKGTLSASTSPCSHTSSPNAVVAAVAAAPAGSVQATVLADPGVVGKVFADADTRRVMNSAWKLTPEYMKYLGWNGVVIDVSTSGAVRIRFEDSVSLWFPAGAVAQFLLPSPQRPVNRQPSLAYLVASAPSAAVRQTLLNIVGAYPQLEAAVCQRLQQATINAATAVQPPPFHPSPAPQQGGSASSSLAQRARWCSTLQDVDDINDSSMPSRRGWQGGGGGSAHSTPDSQQQQQPQPQPQQGSKGLNPHSPPFRTAKERAGLKESMSLLASPNHDASGTNSPSEGGLTETASALECRLSSSTTHTEASGRASPPAAVATSTLSPNGTVISPKHRPPPARRESPQETPWDGVSIVSKVIDDIFSLQ